MSIYDALDSDTLLSDDFFNILRDMKSRIDVLEAEINLLKSFKEDVINRGYLGYYINENGILTPDE